MILEISNEFFPGNLRFLREKYGLSLRSTAQLIGIRSQVLRRIEDGTLSPTLDISSLIRICEVFHITPDTLTQTDLTTER